MTAPLPRVPFSFARLSVIAGNTVLEAVRQKVFLFFLLLGVVFVLGAQSLLDFNFGGSQLKFIYDLGMGTMLFFGSTLTIATTAQLFFSEIENRTALTLLAKPVWRTEFIFGKFLGVWAVVGVFCALLTGLLISLILWHEHALLREQSGSLAAVAAIPYGDLVTVGLLQWLKFGVLAAITLLIASFSNTNLFTVVMSFVILVICHLQALAHRFYENSENLTRPVRLLVETLARIIPNFQLFNVADQVWAPGGVDGLLALRVGCYALVYILVIGALAVYSFRRREI